MNERRSRVACLNVAQHDGDIRDELAHYIGCIEISERTSFFTDDNPLWNKQIDHQVNTLGRTREAARTNVQRKKELWEGNCKSELRRIRFLRKTLKEDRDDRHLVKCVKESRRLWKSSKEYKDGIDLVQSWRNRPHGHRNPQDEVDPNDEPQGGSYDLDRDINAHIIKFKEGEGVDIEHPKVWNHYPDQKTMLSGLLRDTPTDQGQRLLGGKSLPNEVTYFHIPSNNMVVSSIPLTMR